MTKIKSNGEDEKNKEIYLIRKLISKGNILNIN